MLSWSGIECGQMLLDVLNHEVITPQAAIAHPRNYRSLPSLAIATSPQPVVKRPHLGLACPAFLVWNATSQPPDTVAQVAGETAVLTGEGGRGIRGLSPTHLHPVRDVPKEVETLTMNQIEVKSYVGGLVRSFERKVA